MDTRVHLVRHAEVENPNNTWYGRLEGFELSQRGLRQAAALGDYFAHHALAAVYSSPLRRALQTAEAIAQPCNLEVVTDANLIETETRLQGKPADYRVLLNPFNLRHFRNPLLPSWGEPYSSVSGRMLESIEKIRTEHVGRDVVAVSHMLPILVARLRVERNRRPPWSTGVACRKASVTTLVFEEEQYVATSYVEVASAVP